MRLLDPEDNVDFEALRSVHFLILMLAKLELKEDLNDETRNLEASTFYQRFYVEEYY